MMAHGGLQREYLCKDMERRELLARVARERLAVGDLPADVGRRRPIAAPRRTSGQLMRLLRAASAWRAGLTSATADSVHAGPTTATRAGKVG